MAETVDKTQEAMQWNLNDILTEEQFDGIYRQIQQDLTSFAEYKAQLTSNITQEQFLAILNAQEQIAKQFGLLSCYLSLRLATNIKDSKARALQNNLDSLSIQIHDATLFFSQWVKGLDVAGCQTLDDANARRLFKASGIFQYSLQHTRDAAKHSLTESEEKIMHRKDKTGVDVITELYTMITNDFTYQFQPEGKAPVTIQNQQQLLKHVHSSNGEERKAAYQALFTPYKEHADKLFMIYSAVAKDWAQEAELRKYPDSIAMRHRANKVSSEAVNTLLSVCRKNINLFHRFFHIKAKLLGQETLRRYDVYAPLTKTSVKHSFTDAKQIVFDAFHTFWPDFHKKAESILNKQHLDSHPKENKRGGAFCMSINAEIPPYVLTNFDGTNRAISTLAHELGHAVHDLHTTHLPHTISHAPLPLCETASTFAELVVFETLLAEAATEEEKRALLMDKVADSYATIIRQNYFILFEIEAHKALQQGASAKELNDLYYSLLQEQFGDSVEVPEDFAYEWSYIPHIFHSPFYCYAYNFGELLSLSLYAMYTQEGADLFLPKLEKLLKAGGSQDPEKLLASIGIDITSEDFWQGGFRIVEEWVHQLE